MPLVECLLLLRATRCVRLAPVDPHLHCRHALCTLTTHPHHPSSPPSLIAFLTILGPPSPDGANFFSEECVAVLVAVYFEAMIV